MLRRLGPTAVGRSFLVALILALVLGSCGTAQQAPAIDDPQFRAEVDRETATVLDALFAAFSAGDAAGGNGLYALGPDVLHVSNTTVVQMDTITPYTQAAFDELDSLSLSWEPNRLSVLTRDVAIRTIDVTFALFPRDGPTQRSTGVQTLVFQRVGDDWRIVHDQRAMSPN